MLNMHLVPLHLIFNKVKINFNVLYPAMQDRILIEISGTNIITIDQWWFRKSDM